MANDFSNTFVDPFLQAGMQDDNPLMKMLQQLQTQSKNPQQGTLLGFLQEIGLIPKQAMPMASSMSNTPFKAPAQPTAQPTLSPLPVQTPAAAPEPGITAPARPAVLPTTRMWGDQEAINAGLYEDPKKGTPRAQQMVPAQTQPQGDSFDQRFTGDALTPMKASDEPGNIRSDLQPAPMSAAEDSTSFAGRFGDWENFGGDRTIEQPAGMELGTSPAGSAEDYADKPAPWVHSALADMGMKVNPEAWQNFVNTVVPSDNIDDRRPYDSNGKLIEDPVHLELRKDLLDALKAPVTQLPAPSRATAGPLPQGQTTRQVTPQADVQSGKVTPYGGNAGFLGRKFPLSNARALDDAPM